MNDNYHIHVQLEALLVSERDNPCIRLHKNCASRYTSATNVKAHNDHVRKMQYDSDDNEQSAPKRLRSSTKWRVQFQETIVYFVRLYLLFLNGNGSKFDVIARLQKTLKGSSVFRKVFSTLWGWFRSVAFALVLTHNVIILCTHYNLESYQLGSSEFVVYG